MRRSILSVAVSVVLVLGIVALVLPTSTPATLTAALGQLDLRTIAFAIACLTAGMLLSALRLKYIAIDFGYALTMRDATATLSVGQLAGNLFFQFAGQMIGRTAMLARYGIPTAASVMISGYERMFALFISLILAISGAIYLFGRLTFDLYGGGLDLIKLALGLIAAVTAGAAFAWGPKMLTLLRQLTPAVGFRMLRSAAISLTVQLATLSAYVVTAHTLAPQIEYAPIIAASCLVMFASSLPISLGGWGLRELSAVVALQAVGMSSASALVVGLVIGILSLGVVGIAAAVLAAGNNSSQVPRAPAGIDYGLLLDWAIPIAAATAVYFQIFVPVGSGKLNVNLADPLVILGGALFCLRQFEQGWPEWRITGFYFILSAMTVVIVLSVLHGYFVFGHTEWAFTSRLIGWPLLLCYGATGALIVQRSSEAGLDLLLRCFAAAGAAIAALEVCLIVLTTLSGHPHSLFGNRITGFSQNPNAFAFIMLMALAATLTLRISGRARTVLMAAIFVGLWYAGSRAGYIATLSVVVAAVYVGISPRPIAAAALSAAVAHIGLLLFPNIVLGGLDLGGYVNGNTIALLMSSTASSDREHVTTVLDGLYMFMAHPLFGAGLGAYMDAQIKDTGVPLLIHSTPVWLLAETGLAGFAVFVFSGWKIFSHAFRNRGTAAGILIVLMVVAFAVMSEAHELLYQRSLWLLLGAALVVPVVKTAEQRVPAGP